MKRYDQFCTYDGGGPAESLESPEGVWVRHEDAQAEISALRKDAERWRYVARHWFKAKAAWNNDKANTPKALELTIRAQANASQADYIERFIDEAIAAERGATGICAA